MTPWQVGRFGKHEIPWGQAARSCSRGATSGQCTSRDCGYRQLRQFADSRHRVLPSTPRIPDAGVTPGSTSCLRGFFRSHRGPCGCWSERHAFAMLGSSPPRPGESLPVPGAMRGPLRRNALAMRDLRQRQAMRCVRFSPDRVGCARQPGVRRASRTVEALTTPGYPPWGRAGGRTTQGAKRTFSRVWAVEHRRVRVRVAREAVLIPIVSHVVGDGRARQCGAGKAHAGS